MFNKCWSKKYKKYINVSVVNNRHVRQLSNTITFYGISDTVLQVLVHYNIIVHCVYIICCEHKMICFKSA